MRGGGAPKMLSLKILIKVYFGALSKQHNMSNYQKWFEELKWKITQAPIVVLPKLQKYFEVETEASGYAMGVVCARNVS